MQFFIEYHILLVLKCNYEKRGLFSGIPFKAKAALDIMGCTANHVSKTALKHNYQIQNVMAYFFALQYYFSYGVFKIYLMHNKNLKK